jgi:anti-sigma B factor antagonist
MPSPQLDIQTEHVDGVAVVHLNGAIDASSVEDLKRAVEPLCAVPHPKVVLNCAALIYVNSTGYGLFFTWQRACRLRNGQMALCGLKKKIHQVIQVLGLENLLTICATQAEAMDLIKEGERRFHE